MLQKLYDRCLNLARHKLAKPFLGFISFIESSFFPIPPDVLLIPLCLGNRHKALYFAFLCSISSIIGGVIGYFIGKSLWWSIPGIEYSAIANIFFDYVIIV